MVILIYNLDEYCLFLGIETVGKNVLVAGRSKNVGMPIAMLLHTDRNHERPGGERVCVSVGAFVQKTTVHGRHRYAILTFAAAASCCHSVHHK